jgi:hypothetical protein
MILEFNCTKIQTSYKSDALNFAGAGSCRMEVENEGNIIILNFKKFKEMIYFDQTQNSIDFTHQVKILIIMLVK